MPAPDSDFLPRYRGARATVQKTYSREGQRVGVFIGYYSRQREGAELISSQNILVHEKDPSWRRLSQRRIADERLGFDVLRSELRSRATPTEPVEDIKKKTLPNCNDSEKEDFAYVDSEVLGGLSGTPGYARRCAPSIGPCAISRSCDSSQQGCRPRRVIGGAAARPSCRARAPPASRRAHCPVARRSRPA